MAYIASTTWPLESPVGSYALNSTTAYSRGHIRVIDLGMVRLQGCDAGATWEDVAGPLSRKLLEYIGAREHTVLSIAGSGTTYVPCLMRRDSTKVRVQIAGPRYNRSWGVEFVIPSPGVWERLGSPGPVPSLEGFAVGDKVVVVTKGDGDGCGGGPEVGTEGVIKNIKGTTYGCGQIEVKFSSTIWTTTPAHLAKVATEPPCTDGPPLKDVTAPPAFKKKFSVNECINCGMPSGKHYPGGDPPYSPSLCPQPDAFCTICAVHVGPVPLQLHHAIVHKAKTAPPVSTVVPSWAVFGFASQQIAADFEKDHGYDSKGRCLWCDGEEETCYAVKLCNGCGKPFGKHSGSSGNVICPTRKDK